MDDSLTENTPLLLSSSLEEEGTSEPKYTPLPRLQITTVLLIRACEALSTYSIQPFINQFIRDLGVTGGDDRKVGYYVGIIGSLYYAVMAITILYWNRISDHIGRKPILLTGLLGSALSMTCIGLSSTFWALVASRCLWGLLDGNIGVTKSIVGEITDSTNQAQAFALTFVVYDLGATVGPLIGGTLSNPYDRYPGIFRGQFWKQYPYFLPCLATSGLVFFTFLFVLFYFKESLPKNSTPRPEGNDYALSPQEDQPVPLRELLVFPVLISIANYASLEFLNICHNALLPLFFAMPVEIGGLGFDPPRIGFIISAYRAFVAFYLFVFLSPAIRRFGERRVFIYSMSTYLGVFALFPLISFCAKNFGITTHVWVGISLMLFLMAVSDMAYGCIFMIVISVAPNKRSFGITNGLSQTTVSVARTIAPALASSMFSYSVENHILGGHGVYAFLVGLSCCAILLALGLPSQATRRHDI